MRKLLIELTLFLTRLLLISIVMCDKKRFMKFPFIFHKHQIFQRQPFLLKLTYFMPVVLSKKTCFDEHVKQFDLFLKGNKKINKFNRIS